MDVGLRSFYIPQSRRIDRHDMVSNFIFDSKHSINSFWTGPRIRITIETFEEATEKAEDIEEGNSAKKNDDLDGKSDLTPWKIQKLRKIFAYFGRYSFAIFAALFVGFNIVYWTWLFTASEYFEWVTEENKF